MLLQNVTVGLGRGFIFDILFWKFDGRFLIFRLPGGYMSIADGGQGGQGQQHGVRQAPLGLPVTRVTYNKGYRTRDCGRNRIKKISISLG